jgi:hypothetical protein
VTQSRSAISITVTAVFSIGEAAQTSPSDSTGHADERYPGRAHRLGSRSWAQGQPRRSWRNWNGET